MKRQPRADFHTHSTASDGTYAPAELIQESARRGLTHIALTDHDTTGGVRAAIEAGHEHGVTVIAGLEFSAQVERGELHILGYGIDPEHGELQETIRYLRDVRLNRAFHILDRLREAGINLDPEAVQRDNPDESIGRPHIARALVEAGLVSSVGEAFDLYLDSGRPGFVEKALVPPNDAIRLIRAAGGLAVMAHPLSAPDATRILPDLIENGLAGLECYYGEYSDEQRTQLESIALKHDLLPTGGSDFHGPAFKEGRDLGSVDIPPDRAAALISAIGLPT